MYKQILVSLDTSPGDDVILAHVTPLAALLGARVLLVHVADGFVARSQETLDLADSEEIRRDRAYLEMRREEIARRGIEVTPILARGDPAREILEISRREGCDLIAMATHGHGLLGDLFLGSVARIVRHKTSIPILMIRAPRNRT